MQVYVINESDYGNRVLEVPPTEKESSHMEMNHTVIDNAATFLSKKSKLGKLIVEMLNSDDFKEIFR